MPTDISMVAIFILALPVGIVTAGWLGNHLRNRRKTRIAKSLGRSNPY